MHLSHTSDTRNAPLEPIDFTLLAAEQLHNPPQQPIPSCPCRAQVDPPPPASCSYSSDCRSYFRRSESDYFDLSMPIVVLSPLRVASRARILIKRYVSTLPEHRKITMPKVSPTMTEGRLVEWKKLEGQSFEEGEDIASVESDKATMPISAREDGFMARIFIQADTPDIPLGQLLAITVEEQQHIQAFKDFDPSSTPLDQTTPTKTSQSPSVTYALSSSTPQQTPTTAPATNPHNYDGPIGPAVMHILGRYPSLNLDAVTPTGPKGRILKGDVLAAIASGHALKQSAKDSQPLQNAAVSDGTRPTSKTTTKNEPSSRKQQKQQPQSESQRPTYTDIPTSSMRRAIATRLVQSKTQVPHRYASATYTLDTLLSLRKRLNAEDPFLRVSVNDFIIKAAASALVRVPAMNVRYDHATATASPNKSVDISMAVAVENGLITPIIFNAHKRGLSNIANCTKVIVQKAKMGDLDPEEYEGGCFSVSNLGMLGAAYFSAIINPPQSAILAIGAPRKLSHFTFSFILPLQLMLKCQTMP